MRRALTLIVPLAATIMFGAVAFAQSGGTYKLLWSSVDGGGGKSTGGTYAVIGTAGQPDAGKLAGGVYKLTGGFMAASLPNNALMPEPVDEGLGLVTDPTAAPVARKRKKTRRPDEYPTPPIDATAEPVARKRKETPGPNDACVAKPDAPKLKGRALKENQVSRPTLKWTAVQCADTYKVVVKNTLTGERVARKARLTVLKFKPAKLRKGTSYTWSVQACNAHGCTKSAAREFTLHNSE